MWGMILAIFGILLVVCVLSGCSFWWADPKYYKTKELGKKYGGFYIFDKQFADEIKQREMERDKFRKKVRDMSATDEEFRLNSRKYDVNKALPQTLSNGCKYYLKARYVLSDKPEYTYYENKIKEYLGAENYDKVKHFIYIKIYYECNEKIYPIVISLSIPYVATTYGLFGDEGRGFSFSSSITLYLNNASILYLIDDKFVKSDKNYYEEY